MGASLSQNKLSLESRKHLKEFAYPYRKDRLLDIRDEKDVI
jgi:hypothetical protein